jgi:hypothetical protein
LERFSSLCTCIAFTVEEGEDADKDKEEADDEKEEEA